MQAMWLDQEEGRNDTRSCVWMVLRHSGVAEVDKVER